MNTPPFFTGICVLFWGFQTGLWPLAVLMALGLEGSRRVELRWDLSYEAYRRIAAFCGILFFCTALYFYVSLGSTGAILMVIQWFPLTLFPLLAGQAYDKAGGIDVRVLFFRYRRKRARHWISGIPKLDLSYPYAFLCVLSASTANIRSLAFYPALLALSAWALWHGRSKSHSPLLWAALLSLAAVVGYAGHVGLHELQLGLERKAMEWFADFLKRDADPSRTRTAIGDVGSLKRSSRVVLRVEAGPDGLYPGLLQSACYNYYRSSTWLALRSKFVSIPSSDHGTSWNLLPAENPRTLFHITARLAADRNVLSLPPGTARLSGLPVQAVDRNQLGTVTAQGGAGLVTFEVRYGPNSQPDAPPDEIDLMVPEAEYPGLDRVVDLIDLHARPPDEILNRVERYFRTNFKYSLLLSGPQANTSPLSDFLLRTRSGHCEYFATAAALLLRRAGVPARYVTGYAVYEYSPLEKAYVVRARHAHSWTRANVGGVWRIFDVTPSEWANVEDAAAPIWEPVVDLWCWATLKFSRWRWPQLISKTGALVLWGVAAGSILLLFALRRKRRALDGVRAESKPAAQPRPGADSDYYLIEKRLSELGFNRKPGEPPAVWLERIETRLPSDMPADALKPVLHLHYRYRFDPRGITEDERRDLKGGVRSWLENLEKVINMGEKA